VSILTLAGVVSYLGWANGGLQALAWQFHYRADGPELSSPPVWLLHQLVFISRGLGSFSFLALLTAPLVLKWKDRPEGLGLALALSAVPGLCMLLVFRQGADRHPFWAFNLFIPATLALATVLAWTWKHSRNVLFRAVLIGLVLQTGVQLKLSYEQLAEDRRMNARGTLLRDYFTQHPTTVVRFVTRYNFYPFATWYLRVPVDVVPSVEGLRHKLRTGAWPEDAAIISDEARLVEAHCSHFQPSARSREGGWIIAPAETILSACGG